MKRIVSLSLDLDNKWSYLKTHGSDAWREFPSYLDRAVPRILDFLAARDLSITFFIVGQDAALDKNHDALARLAGAGHEIASHSFNHEPWLHLYDAGRIERELEQAEEAIARATGVQVSGFRGPGFSISERVLRALKRRGYRYDATAFPNILNPLARAYFFSRSNLSAEEKEERKALFGNFSDAFRPVKPYRWQLGDDTLLELPVTTMPLLKTPVHFSYLLYLSGYSRTIARTYFRCALAMCRITGTQPSLLLHPLDFLGEDDDSDLGFFPGMNQQSGPKLDFMSVLFDDLLTRFAPVTIGEHVNLIDRNGAGLKCLQPNFSFQGN